MLNARPNPGHHILCLLDHIRMARNTVTFCRGIENLRAYNVDSRKLNLRAVWI